MKRGPGARGGAAAAVTLAAALLAGWTSGCASSLPPPGTPPGPGLARGRPSAGGSYYVVYVPAPDPIPLNQLFRLEVTVYEGRERSRAAVDAGLAVRGWMPEHEHGMSLVPEVRSLGDGRFAVEGMLFHMPGRWQLEMEVRRGGATERATFELEVG